MSMSTSSMNAVPSIFPISSSLSSSTISPPSNSQQQSSSAVNSAVALSSALTDLSSRFFLNLPDAELKSFDRIFYQLEQAHWYYEDFLRVQDPINLPKFALRDFCFHMFESCPILSPHLSRFEELFLKFQKYLYSVPVCGVVMLNSTMTKCVLVRGWNSKTWGFPKGKINEGELPVDCAIREALEEVGYDCSSSVSTDDYLQAHDKEITLFVVRNVDESFQFNTKTRKEISEIKWFVLDDLFACIAKDSPTKSKTKLWGVKPFLSGLQKFIQKEKLRKSTSKEDRLHRSLSASNTAKKVRKTKKSKADIHNETTFGSSVDGWSAEEMFEAHEKLKALVEAGAPMMSPPLDVDAITGSSSTYPKKKGVVHAHSTSATLTEASFGLKKKKKVSATALPQGAFDCDEKGWSVQEMFNANEKLYGVKATPLTNLDELASSMAQTGSRYRSFSPLHDHAAGSGATVGSFGGGGDHGVMSRSLTASPPRSGSSTASRTENICAMSSASDSDSATNDTLEFQLDINGVMGALMTKMKV